MRTATQIAQGRIVQGTRPGLAALALALLLLAGTHVQALDATFDPSAYTVTPVAGQGIPIGTVVAWPVHTNPSDMENWLDCDGRTVQAEEYPELVRILSGGSAATSVRVPNYGGLFLRGFGSQTHTQQNGILYGVTMTRHSSDRLGVVQGDGIRNITGNLPIGNNVGSTSNLAITGAFTYFTPANVQGYATTDSNNVRVSFNASLVVPTASENRPANTAVRYLIRAR